MKHSLCTYGCDFCSTIGYKIDELTEKALCCSCLATIKIYSRILKSLAHFSLQELCQMWQILSQLQSA